MELKTLFTYSYLAFNGESGVDIFFVLSGFLISYVLIKDIDKNGQIDWWNFIRGRIMRIYPVLIIFTCINLIQLYDIFGLDILWYLSPF